LVVDEKFVEIVGVKGDTVNPGGYMLREVDVFVTQRFARLVES
jgi:hypothetical protein